MNESHLQVEPDSLALHLALSFVRRVESGEDATALLTEDAVEEELPNRVFERGARRDVEAMRAGTEKGKRLFETQRYDVKRALGQGNQAVLEIDWSGVLAVPVGSLAAGDTMRASCAFFFELRGERIAKLRHYDSFEPF